MMKGKMVLTVTSACVLLYGGTALADVCEETTSVAGGYYVSGMLGTALLEDATYSGHGRSVDLEYDAGWNLGVMVGYKIDMVRIEGEIGYQQSGVDKFSGGSLRPYTLSGDGNLDIYRFMINGYYDFNTGTNWIPYVGAGIGFATVVADDLKGRANNTTYVKIDDHDNVFAYQIGAGVGYAVNHNTTLFLDYHYFATQDPSFSNVDGEVSSHNISMGLRYAF